MRSITKLNRGPRPGAHDRPNAAPVADSPYRSLGPQPTDDGEDMLDHAGQYRSVGGRAVQSGRPNLHPPPNVFSIRGGGEGWHSQSDDWHYRNHQEAQQLMQDAASICTPLVTEPAVMAVRLGTAWNALVAMGTLENNPEFQKRIFEQLEGGRSVDQVVDMIRREFGDVVAAQLGAAMWSSGMPPAAAPGQEATTSGLPPQRQPEPQSYTPPHESQAYLPSSAPLMNVDGVATVGGGATATTLLTGGGSTLDGRASQGEGSTMLDQLAGRAAALEGMIGHTTQVLSAAV
eukprot:2548122-Prymnesium_polylepis.1